MIKKCSDPRSWILSASGVIFPLTAFAAFLMGRRRLAHLAAITSAALVWGPTLWRNNSAFGPITTRFRTPRREVWLTIDDGPYPGETQEMLELLAEFQAPATFFLVGHQVERHPECVHQILSAGHTIGNHTQHHSVDRFWALPTSSIQREIRECSRALTSAGAPLPRWFRSPVGMTNPFVHPVLACEQLRLIGWHAGGMDGLIPPEAYWKRRVLPRLRPGVIILLHQLQKGGGAATLRTLLSHLQQLGYSCVLPKEPTFI